MRKLMVIVGFMGVLLLAMAMPATATDGALLGSGATAPESDKVAAAPAPVEQAPEVVYVAQAAGEDVLAATGLDSGVALVVGLGLMTAGTAAVLASRKRVRQ